MDSSEASGKPHPHRWIICALLFLATTCNYIDRQVLGILAPELEREFGWSEVTYGHIVTAFQTAYALGLFLSGWLVDRIGSRTGLALAVFLWSLAAMAHGLARNAWHFAMARFGLGLSEAANFPASIKSVTEWFPERERPLAIGIFNCGANVGAVITPILVPFLAITFGWQAAFFALGSVGFVWLLLAWFLFRAPPQSTERRVVGAERVGWSQVLRLRATWAFAIAKFLTDPVWWFYLYWTPKYLSGTFNLNLMALGAPLVIIYLAADIGSIGGGWWSSHLVRRGHDARAARLRVMLVCSIVVLSVMALAYTKSMWLAIVMLSLATAAHQGWSANLFASASSLVPRESVASVIGCGGMAGAIGGILLAETAGHVLEYTGSYVPLFCACASAYIVAWMVFRMLTKGAPITVPESE